MINLESEITIPLNEENEEEIDENLPISKNHLSNFNRASYSNNEKILGRIIIQFICYLRT